jgi:hypothetical protein
MRLEYVRHQERRSRRHYLAVRIGQDEAGGKVHILEASKVPTADIPKLRHLIASGGNLSVPERLAAIRRLCPSSMQHGYRAVPHKALTTVHLY